MNEKRNVLEERQGTGTEEKAKKRNGHKLNGHNGHKLNGHNGHKLNGHNGNGNGKKLNGHNGHSRELVEPIKIDSEIVAVLMELKELREAGHSALCRCHGCVDVIPRALKAGLTKAVYADVYHLKPSDYLGTL